MAAERRDGDDPLASRGASLPPEELKRIEDALYRAVLGRVLRGVAVGAAIVLGSLALAGWLAWTTVKRTLVTDAATALQSDATLRSGLLSGLEIDSATFARLLDSLQIMTLDRAGGAAASDVELRRLIDQLVGGTGEPTTGAAPSRRTPSPRH